MNVINVVSIFVDELGAHIHAIGPIADSLAKSGGSLNAQGMLTLDLALDDVVSLKWNDGCTIERGTGTVPPLTGRNKKKSDSLLGHQITGSREGEERQAANEQQSKTGQGGYCLGGVTQQKDTYVARGGLA